jgi:hypothetical protein
LLSQLKKEGRLNDAVLIQDAVFILYTLLVSHFEVYLRSEGAKDYDEVLVDLHRRIRLIFISWT